MIEWVDSHAGRGWRDIGAIERATGPLYCKSVGWLLSEANGYKMLVPHLSGERDGKANMLGLGDLAIPNKSIVKMKVLAKS
jgi:hypothetical protein